MMAAISEIAAAFFFASRVFCFNCLRHEAVLSSTFLRPPNAIEPPSVAYRNSFLFRRKPTTNATAKATRRIKDSCERKNVVPCNDESSSIIKRVHGVDRRSRYKDYGVSVLRKWLRPGITEQRGIHASTGYDAFFRASRASSHSTYTCQ